MDTTTADIPNGTSEADASARKLPILKRGRPFGPDNPGRPFAAGNPGRPKGSRNRATILAEQLLHGEAELVTRCVVESAMAGDPTAMRLCIDRLVPVRRERTVEVELPPIATAADAANATGHVIALVAAGEITPSEGQKLGGLIELQCRVIRARDLEGRIAAAEKGQIRRTG